MYTHAHTCTQCTHTCTQCTHTCTHIMHTHPHLYTHVHTCMCMFTHTSLNNVMQFMCYHTHADSKAKPYTIVQMSVSPPSLPVHVYNSSVVSPAHEDNCTKQPCVTIFNYVVILALLFTYSIHEELLVGYFASAITLCLGAGSHGESYFPHCQEPVFKRRHTKQNSCLQ